MSLVSFIATVVLVAVGVWMLSNAFLVVKALAILPLLGGFATLIEALSELHLPSWFTSAVMVTVFTVWSLRVIMHKGLIAKIIGGIALTIALFAILDVLGITNVSFIESVLQHAYEEIGKIFSAANSAFSKGR